MKDIEADRIEVTYNDDGSVKHIFFNDTFYKLTPINGEPLEEPAPIFDDPDKAFMYEAEKYYEEHVAHYPAKSYQWALFQKFKA